MDVQQVLAQVKGELQRVGHRLEESNIGDVWHLFVGQLTVTVIQEAETVLVQVFRARGGDPPLRILRGSLGNKTTHKMLTTEIIEPILAELRLDSIVGHTVESAIGRISGQLGEFVLKIESDRMVQAKTEHAVIEALVSKGRLVVKGWIQGGEVHTMTCDPTVHHNLRIFNDVQEKVTRLLLQDYAKTEEAKRAVAAHWEATSEELDGLCNVLGLPRMQDRREVHLSFSDGKETQSLTVRPNLVRGKDTSGWWADVAVTDLGPLVALAGVLRKARTRRIGTIEEGMYLCIHEWDGRYGLYYGSTHRESRLVEDAFDTVEDARRFLDKRLEK